MPATFIGTGAIDVKDDDSTAKVTHGGFPTAAYQVIIGLRGWSLDGVGTPAGIRVAKEDQNPGYFVVAVDGSAARGRYHFTWLATDQFKMFDSDQTSLSG